MIMVMGKEVSRKAGNHRYYHRSYNIASKALFEDIQKKKGEGRVRVIRFYSFMKVCSLNEGK